MPSNNTSVWLPRVIFESALITVSILLALGLDEWRENRQTEETIKQALSNFLSEIAQNKARVDDAAPFNKGLSRAMVFSISALGRLPAAPQISVVSLVKVSLFNSLILLTMLWGTLLRGMAPDLTAVANDCAQLARLDRSVWAVGEDSFSRAV